MRILFRKIKRNRFGWVMQCRDWNEKKMVALFKSILHSAHRNAWFNYISRGSQVLICPNVRKFLHAVTYLLLSLRAIKLQKLLRLYCSVAFGFSARNCREASFLFVYKEGYLQFTIVQSDNLTFHKIKFLAIYFFSNDTLHTSKIKWE